MSSLPAGRPGPGPLRTALGFLAKLGVAAAIFFATGELLGRMLDVVDRMNGYTRLVFAPGPDASLPYRLRPGVHASFVGADVRVNALGLRGPEVPPGPPPPETRRVLLLGDSVVFGQGVAEDSTLAARLAGALAGRGGRWEVLNAGVPGYNVETSARLLGVLGDATVPSDVVLGMHLNDYDRPARLDGLGILRRQEDGGWLERSEFVLLLRWLVRWAHGDLWQQRLQRAAGGGEAQAVSIDRAVAELHRRFYAAPDPAGWARITGGLEALRDEAARRGARLVVAILPESWQMDGGEGTGEPQRRLLAACAAAGVRCLDLRPAFVAAGGGLFTDTQHPNAAGHAVAADAIAAAVMGPG